MGFEFNEAVDNDMGVSTLPALKTLHPVPVVTYPVAEYNRSFQQYQWQVLSGSGRGGRGASEHAYTKVSVEQGVELDKDCIVAVI